MFGQARLRRMLLLAVAALLACAAPAVAGQASSGELFFHPCDGCHPVVDGVPSGELPNDFEGHGIELIGHDALGEAPRACLVCHDDPAADPGQLRLADGTTSDITDDVSQVCFQCHSDKYRDWEAQIHGRGEPGCTVFGCHDPHTPGWIYAEPLPPFLGSGFEFRAMNGRIPFTPLAPPPPEPAAGTPTWFTVMAVIGMAGVGGQITRLVRGRQKR